MNGFKVTMLTAASALLLAAPAMAFHDGGVAKCEGCHTMHNSLNNAQMGTGSGTVVNGAAGAYLLQGGGQPSDACLNCHEGGTLSGYHVSTTGATYPGTLPVNRTPGGDFSWLKLITGATPSQRGHNILAQSHGYTQDARLLTSPGGSYPASNLQCSSCHDPHGKYRVLSDATIVQAKPGVTVPPIAASGSYNDGVAPTAVAAVGVYRILGGKGYLPKSMSSNASVAFVNDPPTAIAPSTYNQSESTNQVRVAYGQGMSEYCANCHAAMLNATGIVSADNNGTGHVHPAGNTAKLTGGWSDSSLFSTTIATNYNAYKKSGDLSGVVASSYDTLVPFEEGTNNRATLTGHASNTLTTSAGPSTGNETVMCLSCHRAHASGFDSMVRYEIGSQFVNNTDSSGTVQGWAVDSNANSYKLAAYNGKPATAYGAYQRPLCNKCHAKD